MIQFYSPDIKETLTLPASESLHCVKVLRKKAGDEIVVTDGKGRRFDCTITLADPRATMVRIDECHEIPPHWGVRIIIGVAPSKNMDRMEWFVEKAVEIGVDRIVMLQCDRSERKTVKIERLQKIAVSAMNQSLKTVVPEIVEMTPFDAFVKTPFEGQRFFGYCDDQTERRDLLDEMRRGSDMMLLVGPEGDFSPREVGQAIECGFLPVTFGLSRLRTETAALYALQAVHIFNSIPPEAARRIAEGGSIETKPY